jgi:polysaccharide export outer membrane protein
MYCKKIVLLVLCFGIMSCVSSRKIKYFSNTDNEDVSVPSAVFETAIQVGDLLHIYVSSKDPETALPFNTFETPMAGNVNGNLDPLPYLVNKDGDVNFPILGSLKVLGKSTRELAAELEAALALYVKEPLVNVRIQNFKVTVLGEVKNPGVFRVENETISILEALGRAGDLTIQGERSTVTLIRTIGNERESIVVDLTKEDLFFSPYFFLAQNDVLYVAPNKAKINSSVVGANTSIIFSSISTLVSIIAILIR